MRKVHVFKVTATVESIKTNSTWDYSFSVVTDTKEFAKAEHIGFEQMQELIQRDFKDQKNFFCDSLTGVEYISIAYTNEKGANE